MGRFDAFIEDKRFGQGFRCHCCPYPIYANKGIYWAKANKTRGLIVESIDPSSVFFVCRECSPTHSKQMDYPWIWENMPLKFSVKDYVPGEEAKAMGFGPAELPAEYYSDYGLVYIIKAVNRYKIGKANDMKKRIKTLQTGCPVPIEAVFAIESQSAGTLEALAHQKFAEHRVLGEWFEFDEAVLQSCIEFLQEHESSY